MNLSKTYYSTALSHLPEFYSSHPEANRTLRMDSGGVCQLCARKTARRVELHSPLWNAGPIMYGDCCLPLAEAALREPHSRTPEQTVLSHPPNMTGGKRLRAWQAMTAITGIGALIAWIERLTNLGLYRSF